MPATETQGHREEMNGKRPAAELGFLLGEIQDFPSPRLRVSVAAFDPNLENRTARTHLFPAHQNRLPTEYPDTCEEQRDVDDDEQRERGEQ